MRVHEWFTCCNFSNNCCLVAEFLTSITDSVFSRLGRRKSKFLSPPPPTPLLLLVKSVRIGSPFGVDVLPIFDDRWNIPLDRAGIPSAPAEGWHVWRSPKTAEWRLDNGKKSEFSRRKPRTKFSDSFESLSCRLCPLLAAMAADERKLFKNELVAFCGGVCGDDWWLPNISFFTRSSSFSFALISSQCFFSFVFSGVTSFGGIFAISDGSRELRFIFAGKKRSKSQSRSKTASSFSPLDDVSVAAAAVSLSTFYFTVFIQHNWICVFVCGFVQCLLFY